MPDRRPRVEAVRRTGGPGAPEVFCGDEQSDIAIDLPRWRALAVSALHEEGVRGSCELSVFFIDEVSMADLNSEHMGKSGPTDVLAFPMDGVEIVAPQGPGAASQGPDRAHPDHDDMPTLLGDVLVCPAVAARQAAGHAGTLDDEIALLLVHGILHVMGHDHDSDPSTAAMRARELAILEKHHWCGPAPAGFRQDHPE